MCWESEVLFIRRTLYYCVIASAETWLGRLWERDWCLSLQCLYSFIKNLFISLGINYNGKERQDRKWHENARIFPNATLNTKTCLAKPYDFPSVVWHYPSSYFRLSLVCFWEQNTDQNKQTKKPPEEYILMAYKRLYQNIRLPSICCIDFKELWQVISVSVSFFKSACNKHDLRITWSTFGSLQHPAGILYYQWKIHNMGPIWTAHMYSMKRSIRPSSPRANRWPFLSITFCWLAAAFANSSISQGTSSHSLHYRRF